MVSTIGIIELSIRSAHGTLKCTSSPIQSGPRSNVINGGPSIYWSSKTGVSLSDILVSYPRHLLGRSYTSADIESALAYKTFLMGEHFWTEGTLSSERKDVTTSKAIKICTSKEKDNAYLNYNYDILHVI